MNMDTAKEITECYQKLISEQDYASYLEIRILDVSNDQPFEAEVDFSTNGNRRSCKRFYLNKETVLMMLNSELEICKSNIEGLQKILDKK